MEQPVDPLKIRVHGHVTIARITLENLNGAFEVERISQKLNSLIDDGCRRMVVDLKHVKYAGSAALGMLMALHKRLKDLEGRLVLSYVDNIMPVLKVSRTDRMFTTAADPKTAVEMLTPKL